MRKFLWNVTVGVVLTGLLVVGTAMAASAAPPERETITFSETFQDEFLTEACGVDVTTTETGRITFLTFPDRPVGPQDLTSIHIDLVAIAGDNSVRFKDVGWTWSGSSPTAPSSLWSSARSRLISLGS